MHQSELVSFMPPRHDVGTVGPTAKTVASSLEMARTLAAAVILPHQGITILQCFNLVALAIVVVGPVASLLEMTCLEDSSIAFIAQEASAQGIARAADSLNAPLSSASETETGPCPPWPSSNVLAASLFDRVLECNRRHSTISQSVNREKPGASEALQ